MKAKLLPLSLFLSFACFSQDFTKFRINEKQKKELLKNGDSNIVMIENYLNENEKSLSGKHPSFTDPISSIESAKKKSTSNPKLYKDICLDCYIAEYKNQLQRLDSHGLTDTKGFEVTIMPMFHDQDSASIKNIYDLILSESKNKYSYDGASTPGGYRFVYFDESTRGTNNPRYLYFHTRNYNTGNPDLEIKGDEKYTFSIVYGNFLDFANFWIKYINPNISIEKLSEKGIDEYTYKLNGETRTLLLKKDTGRKTDNWYIRNM
jgi:hypothetical protein